MMIADAYRAGMRMFAAGLCLITARRNQEPGGMAQIPMAGPKSILTLNNPTMVGITARRG